MSKITRVTIGANRFYRVPGSKDLMPSVTTVLSVISKKFVNRWETGLALTKFRSRLGERLTAGTAGTISPDELNAWTTEAQGEPAVQLTAAGGFGTEAHSIFEAILGAEATGTPVQVDPKYDIVVDNFLTWRKSVPDLQVLHNEMMVYSQTHQYAGAVDAVCKIGDRVIIMDWKTSNQIYVEYALQVAAYAKAFEEMTGTPVHEAWVLRFDKAKKKAPQIKVVKDLTETHETFLAVKKLWTFLQISAAKHFN
jgi:hypothetical protein